MLVKSKIKYIQSLSQKKLRDDLNVFVAEGPKIFEELTSSSNTIPKEIFGTSEWIESHQKWKSIFQEVSQEELSRISSLKTPHKVLTVFNKPKFADIPRFENSITLILDDIQDPGNMGTIIRCADWFGVQNIICSPGCADAYSSKVVQSSMGSIARVQVLHEDLLDFLTKINGVPVFAASLDGVEIRQPILLKEAMLIIGNESKGIDQQLLGLATHKLKIPGKGKADSLNAAVATGILLAFMSPET